MNTFLTMTNAVKASIIAVINAFMQLLLAFGVDVSDGQQTAIIVFVNAVLALWVAITFSLSHKRIAE